MPRLPPIVLFPLSACLATLPFLIYFSSRTEILDTYLGAYTPDLSSYTPDFSNVKPNWLSSASKSKDRTVDVLDLQALQLQLEERFEIDIWRYARQENGPALQRLGQCLTAGTCGPGEETVVILASFHFSNALKGYTGGEDIWASSTMEAFRDLNYTLLYTFGAMDTLTVYQAIPNLVKLIFWEGQQFQQCLDRKDTNHLETEDDASPGDWQLGAKGCIAREGFEEGIPVWKSFVFHFWGDPKSPLGQRWTLAPEDYAHWQEDGVGNNYLGYSIETACSANSYIAPEDRPHRALALGKHMHYFQKDWNDFTWPDLLGPTAAKMPHAINSTTGDEETFRLIAAAQRFGEKNDPPIPMPMDGVENIGPQQKKDWLMVLGQSKFLLGVGSPWHSPSPYDALCVGVPFINPIFYWDAQRPDDWRRWQCQHNGIRSLGPPYVYNVRRDDAQGLEAAFRAAIETPIERYIPPTMTREAVLERHRILGEWEWRSEALQYVNHEFTEKGLEFPFII